MSKLMTLINRQRYEGERRFTYHTIWLWLQYHRYCFLICICIRQSPASVNVLWWVSSELRTSNSPFRAWCSGHSVLSFRLFVDFVVTSRDVLYERWNVPFMPCPHIAVIPHGIIIPEDEFGSYSFHDTTTLAFQPKYTPNIQRGGQRQRTKWKEREREK